MTATHKFPSQAGWGHHAFAWPAVLACQRDQAVGTGAEHRGGFATRVSKANTIFYYIFSKCFFRNTDKYVHYSPNEFLNQTQFFDSLTYFPNVPMEYLLIICTCVSE